jgi:hypothetical protein
MINASHDTVDLFTLTFLFTADTELTHVAHSRSARSRQAALGGWRLFHWTRATCGTTSLVWGGEAGGAGLRKGGKNR